MKFQRELLKRLSNGKGATITKCISHDGVDYWNGYILDGIVAKLYPEGELFVHNVLDSRPPFNVDKMVKNDRMMHELTPSKYFVKKGCNVMLIFTSTKDNSMKWYINEKLLDYFNDQDYHFESETPKSAVLVRNNVGRIFGIIMPVNYKEVNDVSME